MKSVVDIGIPRSLMMATHSGPSKTYKKETKQTNKTTKQPAITHSAVGGCVGLTAMISFENDQ